MITPKNPKTIITCIILFCCTGLLLYCNKKTSTSIRIKGSFIDWKTNRPIQCRVSVSSDNSYKQERIHLESFDLNADGTFHQQISAGKTGKYYIVFGGDASRKELRFEYLPIADGSTHDFGRLETTHRIFCRVTIEDSSASNRYVYFEGLRFGPGPPAVVMTNQYMSRDSAEKNGGYVLNYEVHLNTIDIEKRRRVIPLTTSDTLTATIKY